MSSILDENSHHRKEKMLRTTCFLCHGGCTLLAQVRDGELIKVQGDPEGPLNRGSICEKGNAAIQYINSPYRLRYPLKRAGKRGEGKWERISWDEALDATAKKLTDKGQIWRGKHCLCLGHRQGRTQLSPAKFL